MNQTHPLIRFINDNQDTESFHRVVGCKLHRSEAKFLPSGIYMIRVSRWSITGAKTIEKMVYHGISMQNDILSECQAEKLVDAMTRNGEDWLEASTHMKPYDYMDSYWNLMDHHDEEFSSFEKQMKNENYDQVDLRITNLNSHVHRQKEKLENIIMNLKLENKMGTIPMREKQISNLLENAEVGVARLESAREIQAMPTQVMVGICNVF
jgi:hypothetical protein